MSLSLEITVHTVKLYCTVSEIFKDNWKKFKYLALGFLFLTCVWLIYLFFIGSIRYPQDEQDVKKILEFIVRDIFGIKKGSLLEYTRSKVNQAWVMKFECDSYVMICALKYEFFIIRRIATIFFLGIITVFVEILVGIIVLSVGLYQFYLWFDEHISSIPYGG